MLFYLGKFENLQYLSREQTAGAIMATPSTLERRLQRTHFLVALFLVYMRYWFFFINWESDSRSKLECEPISQSIRRPQPSKGARTKCEKLQPNFYIDCGYDCAAMLMFTRYISCKIMGSINYTANCSICQVKRKYDHLRFVWHKLYCCLHPFDSLVATCHYNFIPKLNASSFTQCLIGSNLSIL